MNYELPRKSIHCFDFKKKTRLGVEVLVVNIFNLLDPEFLRASNICLDRSSYNGPCIKNGSLQVYKNIYCLNQD